MIDALARLRRSAAMAFAFAVAACASAPGPAAVSAPTDQAATTAASDPERLLEQTLTGVFDASLHRAYHDIHFQVPEGVLSISVSIDYERGDPWAAIDLALFDPERFRGASGFAKTQIEIANAEATPSYLPGPIPAGEWTLVLGGANAPEGRSTPYTVRISMTRAAPGAQGFVGLTPQPDARWYRGDLHVHTGHSDGRCAAPAGERVPCPVYRTLEAAVAAGLDFVAVTDHNTVSHMEALAELQPYFNKLTLLPGQEVTTYHGHMNVFGTTAPVDFRLGTPSVPDFSAVKAQATALGGLLSINHPGISLTDGCPGCGWSASLKDGEAPDAVEVVNGVTSFYSGGPEGPQSSLPFWRGLLDQGLRVTAIGGSDNHDPDTPAGKLSAIGGPTTVVFASDNSSAAIIDGVRKGRVFVDIDGTKTRTLDLSARTDQASAEMGGVIAARAGEVLRMRVSASAAEGGRYELWRNGRTITIDGLGAPLKREDVRVLDLVADGRPGWISVNVHDAEGRLILIGNPIYVIAADTPANE